jgi:predicted transcriptional regulator
MGRNTAKTRNQTARITTTLDSSLKRLLDVECEGRGLTRSEAVEEAISEWVARRVWEDAEDSQGVAGRLDELADLVRRQGNNTRSMLHRNRYVVEMILELLMEFRPGTSREDLRRKAHAVIEAERERDRSRRRREPEG